MKVLSTFMKTLKATTEQRWLLTLEKETEFLLIHLTSTFNQDLHASIEHSSVISPLLPESWLLIQACLSVQNMSAEPGTNSSRHITLAVYWGLVSLILDLSLGMIESIGHRAGSTDAHLCHFSCRANISRMAIYLFQCLTDWLSACRYSGSEITDKIS